MWNGFGMEPVVGIEPTTYGLRNRKCRSGLEWQKPHEGVANREMCGALRAPVGDAEKRREAHLECCILLHFSEAVHPRSRVERESASKGRGHCGMSRSVKPDSVPLIAVEADGLPRKVFVGAPTPRSLQRSDRREEGPLFGQTIPGAATRARISSRHNRG